MSLSTKLDVPTPEAEFIKDYFGSSPFNCKKLRGEVSTRQYYRVSSEKKSLILVKYPNDKLLELYRNSEKIMENHQVPCPKTIFYQDGSLYICIEDIGDWHLYHSLLSKSESRNQEIEDSFQLAKTFAKIKDHPSFQRELIKDRWSDEWRDIEEFFIHKYLYQDKSSKLSCLFIDLKNEIHERSQNLPKVYIHRDFHSKNIIIFKNNNYIIDHQDLMRGPIGYDQVSLVFDAYSNIEDKNLYSRIPISEEEFSPLAIQRCLKAISTFCKVYVQSGRTDYLHYLFNSFSKMFALECSGKTYKNFKNELISLI